MRLPFPERIPMQYAATFAAVLYVVEQLQGTNALFSVCVMLFIIIATFAFNVAGGFTTPSGGYVFFYATLGAIIGWVTKAVLGEPADSNLLQPDTTAKVFLGGIFSLALAVLVARRFSRKKGLLTDMLAVENLGVASIGCASLGILFMVLSNIVPHEEGSFISAAQQLGNLLTLAIIFGVLHEIRISDGRRSVNSVVFISSAAIFIVSGLINFSKEGLFTPIVCYLITVCSVRFRMSLRQAALIAGAAFLITTYLVPYSQYGRLFRSQEEQATLSRFLQNADAAATLLVDLGSVRASYKSSAEEQKEQGLASGYYNDDEAILDRLQMILPDDKLIDAGLQGKDQFGLYPLLTTALNFIPHFLWPEKPTIDWGNLYAHQIGGILADNDSTTGISFSPSGQAFYMAGWFGVLFVAPLVWIACFLVVDSLCGDTRTAPWGLLFLVYFAHAAPELMLVGPITAITWYSPTVIVIALFCAYVMPFVAGVLGRKRTQLVPASTAPAAPTL